MKPTEIDPGHDPRVSKSADAMSSTRRRRSGARGAWIAVSLLTLGLVVVPASEAYAQTIPAGGGTFAAGSVTSVSGQMVDLKSANGGTDATVTLTDSTKYQKTETAALAAITTGACVRIIGKGNAKKGIKATTVAITPTSTTSGSSGSGGCGVGGAGGFPGGGQGQPPFGNGGTPPQGPSGGNAPNGRFPNGANGRRAAGIASGTVKSINGNKLVVRARTFSRRPKAGSTPKLKTQNVKVTLSSKTTITQTVTGSASDIATGKCLTAFGTGDSSAVTADNVTISDPQNGSCTAGFGGGFGGGAAPGGSTTT